MIERESKFAADQDLVLPDLTGAVPGASPAPAEERLIEDTYVDTADLRLLQWGCTLRHRKRAGWTAKLPAGVDDRLLAREEVVVPGPAGPPPDLAATLVRPFSLGAPLAPVARSTTERTATTWLDPAGTPVLELVDDRVRASAIGGAEITYRQLEVELAPGADPAVLDVITERLEAAGARPDVEGRKLAKVVGDRLPDGPVLEVPELGKRPTAREVVARAVARSVDQLVRELPRALAGGDPEGVHQARVATRRLRSDLRTFRPLLDPAWAEAIGDELRELAADLGRVRDADVLQDLLAEALERHPDLAGPEADAVLARLDEQREEARATLIGLVGSGGVDRLLDDLLDAAADPRTVEGAEGRAKAVLPALVARRWRKLDRAVGRLGPDPAAPDLHRVRILAKRARYAAEAVQPVVGRPAKRLARALAEVQDTLGVANDLDVAIAWLATAAATLDPVAAFAAGRLAQSIDDDRERLCRDWTEPWRRAARSRNVDWLD